MLTGLLARAIGFGLAVGFAAGIPGSRDAAGQAVFRSGIDLVNFGVTVVDRKGELVMGLDREDFVLVEEGTDQRIEYFARGLDKDAGVPDLVADLHVGLLFDTSGSMTEDLSFSRSAAIKFLNTLPQAEDMTLVDFDTQVRVAKFTQREFPRLVERIRTRKPEGYTALYDALGVYLDGADLQSGRKILVIYTDGGDTRSTSSFQEVMTLIKASDVTIYAVGFLEHQSPSVRTQQRMYLQQIADETGGRAFFPMSAKQLDEMYEKILAELKAQYTLGYQSTDPRRDGAWRTVEVRLKRPDLKGAKIRTRKGYFAPYAAAEARP